MPPRRENPDDDSDQESILDLNARPDNPYITETVRQALHDMMPQLIDAIIPQLISQTVEAVRQVNAVAGGAANSP
ncbi:hypothetical protein RYX45_20000, partial [Alkalihalophilus pseudofirmus]